MVNIVLALFLLIPAHCFGSEFRIVRIINQITNGDWSPMIRTSDQMGSLVMQDGTGYKQLQGADGVRQKWFDLRQVSSLNYVVPDEDWDKDPMFGNKAGVMINIALPKRWDAAKKQYVLGNADSAFFQNRGGKLYLQKWQNGKLVATPIMTKKDKDVNITVVLQADGQVVIPSILNVTFANSVGVPVNVGSPDCSTETDISKQFQLIQPGQSGVVPIVLHKSKCKIMAQDAANPQRQAYMCLNEQGVEYNCDAADCPSDPITGVSICNNFGIVWNRGPLKRVDPLVVEVPYGLIRRINQQDAVNQLIYGTSADQDIRDTAFGFLVGAAAGAMQYGQSAAYDFPNLVWKYQKVDEATHSTMFHGAFCTAVQTDPNIKQMMLRTPNDPNISKWFDTYHTICNRQPNYDEAAKQLIYGTPAGQDVRDSSLALVLGASSPELVQGRDAAYDFPNLVWKYSKVDDASNHNAKLRDAFCCVTKRDPKARALMQKIPTTHPWYQEFNKRCQGKC